MNTIVKPAPWDVLEEHLDEAEALFVRWREVIDDAELTIGDLRDGYEARLLAHVDALDVGGAKVMQELVQPVLLDPDASPARAAAAALPLLLSSDQANASALLARLHTLAEPARQGVTMALAMCGRSDLAKPIAAQLERPDAALRVSLLDALTVRGDDTKGALEHLMLDDDSTVRAAALRAAVGCDRRFQPWIEREVSSTEPTVRDAAIVAGLVMGSEAAWVTVGRLALERGSIHREAILATAIFADSRVLAALIARLGEPEARPHLLWALGFSGRTNAVDACIAGLSDAVLGPLAGEAFAAITGLDTRDTRYWERPEPAAPASVPADDDEPGTDTAALGSTTPSELPVPRAEPIARWWAEQRNRFAPDQRYILGRPADHGSLATALRCESLRRRHARAFELLVRTRGQTRVHTRMLAGVQLRELAAAGAWPRIDGNRSYSRIA